MIINNMCPIIMNINHLICDCQENYRIMYDNFTMELINIQKRIRECIMDSDIKQKDIAKLVGVSPQTISKYMKKNIFPALDTLAKLCKILDVSADYILGINKF